MKIIMRYLLLACFCLCGLPVKAINLSDYEQLDAKAQLFYIGCITERINMTTASSMANDYIVTFCMPNEVNLGAEFARVALSSYKN